MQAKQPARQPLPAALSPQWDGKMSGPTPGRIGPESPAGTCRNARNADAGRPLGEGEMDAAQMQRARAGPLSHRLLHRVDSGAAGGGRGGRACNSIPRVCEIPVKNNPPILTLSPWRQGIHIPALPSQDPAPHGVPVCLTPTPTVLPITNRGPPRDTL